MHFVDSHLAFLLCYLTILKSHRKHWSKVLLDTLSCFLLLEKNFDALDFECVIFSHMNQMLVKLSAFYSEQHSIGCLSNSIDSKKSCQNSFFQARDLFGPCFPEIIFPQACACNDLLSTYSVCLGITHSQAWVYPIPRVKALMTTSLAQKRILLRIIIVSI